MFFETQRTQSSQRIKTLKVRCQEEAKASSQRANAVFCRAALSVQCRRHLLKNSVSSIILCVLCVRNNALCPQCSLC